MHFAEPGNRRVRGGLPMFERSGHRVCVAGIGAQTGSIWNLAGKWFTIRMFSEQTSAQATSGSRGSPAPGDPFANATSLRRPTLTTPIREKRPYARPPRDDSYHPKTAVSGSQPRFRSLLLPDKGSRAGAVGREYPNEEERRRRPILDTRCGPRQSRTVGSLQPRRCCPAGDRAADWKPSLPFGSGLAGNSGRSLSSPAGDQLPRTAPDSRQRRVRGSGLCGWQRITRIKRVTSSSSQLSPLMWFGCR